jgi:hypothetical protein
VQVRRAPAQDGRFSRRCDVLRYVLMAFVLTIQV